MIENYSFGKIVVGGKEYRRDLIIHPGGIIENWWRKKGHEVCEEDLLPLMDIPVKFIIFGTGKFGMVKIKDSAVKLLTENGISFESYNTAKAVDVFNQANPEITAGAFHLTC